MASLYQSASLIHLSVPSRRKERDACRQHAIGGRGARTARLRATSSYAPTTARAGAIVGTSQVGVAAHETDHATREREQRDAFGVELPIEPGERVVLAVRV